ncbi:MAG TPA: sulfite exporter TauE/SafE family protein [Gaiellaceae bacterium]
MLRLVLIGLAAGVLSALFGVGGGLLIVPLLILAASFTPREATATSLGAIGLTALAGAVLYALRGEVDVAYAALIGLPAVVGALGGTALQQRVSNRVLTAAFAAFVAGIGIWFLVV